MSSQNGRRLEIEEVRTVVNPAATFAVLGDPLDHPAVAILFVNASDGLLFITDDPDLDKIPMIAGSSFIFDIRSNSGIEPIAFSEGKQFYVRREGAATGNVYMTPFYMRE